MLGGQPNAPAAPTQGRPHLILVVHTHKHTHTHTHAHACVYIYIHTHMLGGQPNTTAAIAATATTQGPV